MNGIPSQGDEILGRGVAFPLRLENGTVGVNAYESQVEQSIRLILRTGEGERVMRPEFGAGAESLAFEPISAVTAAVLQHRIKETLQQFEPRIEVLNVDVNPAGETGELRADIQYRVKRTDSTYNLVYPFYLERGEG